MGRGKVQLKRIEDKISRQVTFSKRKGGLMKKANELAVLCDVEVALLIFSDRGRLYEFCSTESLEEILERYRIHAEEEAAVRKRAEQEKMNLAECTDLQTSGNPLQMIQRHLDTQNIELKNMTELTQLEKEMDAILRQIRFRKTQLMMDAAKAVHEENSPCDPCLVHCCMHWCAICQEHREMKNHLSDNAAVAMTIVMLHYMTHLSHLSCQLLSTSQDHTDTSPSTACTAKPHRVNDHGVAEDLHDSTYPAFTSVNDAAKERRSLPLLPDDEDLHSQGKI